MSEHQLLLNTIISSENIVLTTHVKPDGDALGSMFGMADVLEAMGKNVLCFLEKPVSSHLSFLPHSDSAVCDLQELRSFVQRSGDNLLSMILDCGDCKRIGDNYEELLDIHPSIVIDHHLGNEGYGDINWIESNRSSTGEMAVDLCGLLGLELSKEAAICFYVAIVSDSGSFRYESTTAHTMKVAAKLLERGVRPHEVMQELYDNYPLGRIQLLQMVLGTLQVFVDNSVAVIQVDGEMLTRTGTTLDDTEEFISHIRAIKGIRVAVFMKNVLENQISVSLRGSGTCDLSKVAREFGGGGHYNAAGFRISEKNIDGLRDRLIGTLQAEMVRFDNS
ncbi:MAG: bifunctional oligoribonuclease/PAP phosphatase NrnA [Desulfobulbaceae bacterium]|nr:bifunctional oligoribonuclease/PAP phosphatase NrnA [Desulfobulbaceae bacterium]